MMQPRRSLTTSSTMDVSSSSCSLQFDKRIISTIKSNISNKELITRLMELHEELSNLDDEDVDLSSLKSVSKDLVDKRLLNHPSIGVQAFACCCLSDILRLYAPNAPYSDEQLSVIFESFFKQFSRIATTGKMERPQYYLQYVYLLKRLAETKSIILILDLHESQKLMKSLFDAFYSIGTKQNFPRELETLVTDILSEVISESEAIPLDIIKMILNKFEIHGPNNQLLAGNITTPEFNFSLAVCENNVDRMSRLVAQYFSEILYTNSNKLEIDHEQELEFQKRSENEFLKALDALKKIHHLSVQLWTFVPSIMSSVICLVDDELNASDERVRALATTTIGKMLGSETYSSTVPLHKVNFFVIHRSIWQNWLKKTNDVSHYVRTLWVNLIPGIFVNNQYLTNDISRILSDEFKKCMVDTDHRVREAACVALSKIPYDIFITKVANKEILQILSQLIREKHKNIRSTSIQVLSSIYYNHTQHVVDHDEVQSDQDLKNLINDIPNQILSLIYINDKSITALVDESFFEKLVPVSEPNTVKRVQKLVSFYSVLNGKSKEAFTAILRRQSQIANVIENFLTIADECNKANSLDKENNPPSSELLKSNLTKLEKILNWLCISFPDDYNTYSCLERLFKLNRARFYHLIRTCISSESDLNTINRAFKELLSKLADPKNIRCDDGANVTPAEMVYNTKLLILRGSPSLFNRSNVEELISYSKSSQREFKAQANELLEQMSTITPEVFKHHVRALVELCMDQNETSKAGPLKTIYHFVKKFPESFPGEILFTESLVRLAVDGSPEEAKYSTKVLSLSDRKEVCFNDIIDKVYPLNFTDAHFGAHLSSIAELFLVDKFSISDKESTITEFLIKSVLLENTVTDDHQTYKLLAIRYFINSLKSYIDDPETAKEKSAPVIKLLLSIIGNEGEIVNKTNETWPTPEPYKAKLRLTAGKYLLKMAKIPIYNEVISSSTMRKLCFLLNDKELSVRSQFSKKLRQYLATESISEKYLSLVFFIAVEQDPALKNENTLWVKSMFKRSEVTKNLKFEKSLVRLIHNIVHHERFLSILNSDEEGSASGEDSRTLEAYSFATRFLTYYVQLIAKAENISLLYYLASRVKQHRDATIPSEEYEKLNKPQKVFNLYRIAELAQLVLKTYSDFKIWPIQTWTEKFKLPQGIYAPMASPSEAQSVVSQVFIHDGLQGKLVNLIKKETSDSKRKQTDNGVAVNTSKRPKPASTAVKRIRNKKSTRRIEKPSLNVAEPTRRSNRVKSKVDYKDQIASEDESDSYMESESDFE
ncbi:Pds5 protein [Candida orthopsilosis Co 90-125]|uniref:Pds5 protein n=1 Tax=Candida orthopsilosis (strain 90-125) TaxID=1136231 RepID=H8X1E6_CANO9|nr:Pds5 protein [Candida orthopsilosis Co 90-125]CCG22186.1 Pds5 protein [Candida orthopsilosis Co 90-125]